MTAFDVEINDKISSHADGVGRSPMVLTVLASDIIESVREVNFLHREVARLRALDSLVPLCGTVLPDGSVKFRDETGGA